MHAAPSAKTHSHAAQAEGTCKNCGQNVRDNFCSHCGQTTHTHAVNWHYIWHEIPHSVWHVDRGILFSLRELCTRPGHTIREFLAGKRVNHYRPLALLLILGTVWVFLSHALGVDLVPDAVVSIRVDPDASAQAKAFPKLFAGFFKEHQTLIQILSIPLYAFSFWLLFRRRGYNYPQFLVAQTFIANFALLISILLMVLPWLLPRSGITYNFLSNLKLLGMLVYSVVVYRQFYQPQNVPVGQVIWRSIVAYLLGYVFVVIAIVAIAAGYLVYTGLLHTKN